MQIRKVAVVVCLFVVLAGAGWLMLDWYHLFGEPTAGPRIFITASTDATLSLDDGAVQATGGQYIRAGERSGFWVLTNVAPLGLIVFASMLAGRLR